MADKLRVALLFGGRSSEHSVSCATAGGVLSALDPERYEVIPVGITREGAFTLVSADPANYRLNPDQLPEIVDDGSRVLWPNDPGSRQLRVREAAGGVRSLGEVDVMFPILHGRFGEDGTLQGMLEVLGLPYVGCGVLASALGMDKHRAKVLFADGGIQVAPWVTVTPAGWARDEAGVREVVAELGYPVFVKPARAGSSVGVSRVEEASGLAAALDTAFLEDSSVLVEAEQTGREIELAVLGGRGGADPRVSVAGEIVVTDQGFYDFESKYLDAPGVELICPAVLTPAELAEVQGLAIRAFELIGGEGLARVDFFFTARGWVISEINTMPGFTPISMFPRCWQASGLSYPALLDDLIAQALERG